MEPTTSHLPPQNTEAEASLLGAILIDSDAIVKIADLISTRDFYDPRHRHIYEAALLLYEKHQAIDVLTLADQLKNAGVLDLVGGASYLTELTNFVPTAAHVEQYADIVAQKALRRRLIEASQTIVGLGFDESKGLHDLIEEAETKLFDVSQTHIQQTVMSLETILAESFDRLDELHKDKSKIRGLPTGFKDLDNMLAGLQKSDLFVLAARTSMGKTALALNLAHNVAVQTDQPVLIFSLEMSKEQLVDRLLSMESGVDAWSLRTGNLSDSDFEKIGQAMGTLSETKIYIDDTPSITVSDLRTKARREAHVRPLGLIIVDYLQLMSGGSRFGNDFNRVQEVSEISRGLKGVARELNVPLLALSQLSRSVESRSPQIPQLADLRESGCLTGDTLVHMPETGQYRPIQELVGASEESVTSLGANNKFSTLPIARAFKTGVKPVYRLTTATGRTIRATANHKFLTINGWRRLDELKVTEHLAVPRQLPEPSLSTQFMSQSELALLGHLIGDGCTLPRHAIQYTTNDLNLAHEVAMLAKVVFGNQITPTIKHEVNWYQVYLTAATHLTHETSNPIATWLRGFGAFGLRSHQKFVPKAVFSQSNKAIGVFLRHLWSTDGCVYLSKHPTKPLPVIYYATSSEGLARDIQSLLLRLGITAIIKRVSQGNKGRDQFHVHVSGINDMVTFTKEIGAVGDIKKRQLALVNQFISKRQANTNRDIIPKSAWQLFAIPAMRENGVTTRQMQRGLNTTYCGSTIYKSNLSRNRAALLSRVVKSKELASLSNSDIYWDRIKTIEPAGIDEVFDLTIPETHNFVAADIIVHNSIEQDADVVAFLYREDYYNPETDRKNITDVLIKKHRNGPTGGVELFFDRDHQRFRSLDTKHRDPFIAPSES